MAEAFHTLSAYRFNGMSCTVYEDTVLIGSDYVLAAMVIGMNYIEVIQEYDGTADNAEG